MRVEVIGIQLAGLAAVVCLALVARASLALSALYMFKAAGCFLVIGALVMRFYGAHHPFPRFGIANGVTTGRAVMVALLAGLLGESPSAAAAWAITLTSLATTLLDGVDGWLARRSGMMSAFGARFDMEVDALLTVVLAILVWRHERAGAWVVASGVLRYLFVAAGWVLPWMRRPLPPSVRRQAICVVQIAGLILAIAPVVPPVQAAQLTAIGLAALGYSFLVDTVWLWRSDRREQVA